MVFSRDYVCVAVPLYNVGIYAILGEQLIVGLIAGVLSFAAPSIVAVSIPSFGAYIFGAICLVVAGLQGWGFFGVYKEKPEAFKKYLRINLLGLGLVFALSLVWIVVSAARHTKAVSACVKQFAQAGNSTTAAVEGSIISVNATSTSGDTICNIFTWVQMGIMGVLWLFFLVAQAYFYMCERIYGSEQRLDHKRYNNIYNEQRDSFIRQSSIWDASNAPKFEDGELAAPRFGHLRSGSAVSKASSLRNEWKTGDESDINEKSTRTRQASEEPMMRPGSMYSHLQRHDRDGSFGSQTSPTKERFSQISPIKERYASSSPVSTLYGGNTSPTKDRFSNISPTKERAISPLAEREMPYEQQQRAYEEQQRMYYDQERQDNGYYR